MKKKLIFGLMSIVFLLLSSCKTEVTKRSDFKEVMKVHDEAMARMGEIHELKKQVKSLATVTSDSVIISESHDIIEKLDMADEEMMSWMAEFKIPEDGPDDQLTSYFAAHQVKVDKVSKDIDLAIRNAAGFIKKHK